MNKDLDYYMSLPYRVEVIPDEEEGGFALHCPDLNGCMTCAETLEDGFKMLEDAKRCWFTACLEDGIPIPEPTRLEDYSGQFKLRLPKSLHRLLAQKSSEEGVSMNQYCVYLLSKGIRERKLGDENDKKAVVIRPVGDHAFGLTACAQAAAAQTARQARPSRPGTLTCRKRCPCPSGSMVPGARPDEWYTQS